jgi:PAS domain S-box-containing protein
VAEESTQQYLRSIDVDKKLISSIDNGIIILDDELKISYYNKWLEIHTSIKEKDVLGKEIYTIFENINIKTLRRKIKIALLMGTPSFYIASTSKYLIPIKINQIEASDFNHMRQDVSIIPFDVEKKLVALIITDQTVMINTNILLKSNIQKVEELNKELLTERGIVDERVLYLKIDTTNNITDCSRAYLDLLGFEKIDIYKQNFFDYEKLSLNTELREEIKDSIAQMKVLKYEKITLTREGREVWLLNTLVPEYDKNGSHLGFIIFAENITSAKLVQEHQSRLLENSRTAAMGEMISMIAHQWRQPLSVINTLIATLRIKKELDMLDDKVVDESFTKIEKTVGFLSDTINDFRNFFKKNKELTETTIQIVFDKSTNLLKSDMLINEIMYEENIDTDILLSTYQNELVQTIMNILKNSIDAFKENPQENQILHIKAYLIHTNVIIEIQDNAGGIPKDILSKVFEPYFSTKSKNGTGLGLYVCKTIIEEHLDGKLTMSSRDHITKTTIELPKNLQIKKEY